MLCSVREAGTSTAAALMEAAAVTPVGNAAEREAAAAMAALQGGTAQPDTATASAADANAVSQRPKRKRQQPARFDEEPAMVLALAASHAAGRGRGRGSGTRRGRSRGRGGRQQEALREWDEGTMKPLFPGRRKKKPPGDEEFVHVRGVRDRPGLRISVVNETTTYIASEDLFNTLSDLCRLDLELASSSAARFLLNSIAANKVASTRLLKTCMPSLAAARMTPLSLN
jgi:hypothetical protein